MQLKYLLYKRRSGIDFDIKENYVFRRAGPSQKDSEITSPRLMQIAEACIKQEISLDEHDLTTISAPRVSRDEICEAPVSLEELTILIFHYKDKKTD